MSDLATHFLLVRPHTGKAKWLPSNYPWDDLLDELDARAPERRQQMIGQFTRPLTYDVREVGAKRLLSIHQVDVAARRSEADAGVVTIREFGTSGGPTNASHLMPIEDDIFALAIETGGPTKGRVAAYIGVVAGPEYEPSFTSIERTDGTGRLKKMTRASSVSVTAATAAIVNLSGQDAFTKALRAVSKELDTDEIRLWVKVNRRQPATDAWFRKTKPELEQFLDGDRAAILDARAGNERLLEVAVTSTAYVGNTRGSVPPGDVVLYMEQQYREKRDEIQESLGRRP